jgi:hypothetical protein
MQWFAKWFHFVWATPRTLVSKILRSEFSNSWFQNKDNKYFDAVGRLLLISSKISSQQIIHSLSSGKKLLLKRNFTVEQQFFLVRYNFLSYSAKNRPFWWEEIIKNVSCLSLERKNCWSASKFLLSSNFFPDGIIRILSLIRNDFLLRSNFAADQQIFFLIINKTLPCQITHYQLLQR